MPTEHIEVEVTVLQEGRSAYRPRGCCESLLAVLLPPVYLCLRGHKCCTIIINVILTLCGLWPGMIHALVKEGTGCCSACLICLLPPVGLWMAFRACNCDVLICLLFTLTIFGGIWWAVWKADKHPRAKLSQS